MPYIKVDKENSADVKLYYEDHGSGQPVVLIHGFPMSGDAWEKQKLALVGAGYRTITYDRRGFGKSDKPAFGYDYDTFVNDLERVLDELDLKNVVLMGHSMGTGEVTHYLGTRGRARVARAVLISPLQPFLLKTEDNPEGVDRSVFDEIQGAILADRPEYLTRFFDAFYNLDENLGGLVSQQVVNANWNVAVEASPKGTHDCVDSWLTDFRPDLPKIDVPVLIVQGNADQILPYEVTGGRLQHMLKDCRLVTLAGAPHGIPWTHAAEINREVLAFLAEEAEGEQAGQPVSARRPEPAFGETLEADTQEVEEE
ncbi:MAG TPA: alpha/beta hydrolase [Candidatus Saccharimonadia bacterium]|jgi:non-heme chloroperoxidase